MKIAGISSLSVKMSVTPEKDGSGTEVSESLSLNVAIGIEEAEWIRKQAKLNTKWTLELYPASFNYPMDTNKAVKEAIKDLRPKEGSDIDSVTLSAGDKSVTLHKKTKKAL